MSRYCSDAVVKEQLRMVLDQVVKAGVRQQAEESKPATAKIVDPGLTPAVAEPEAI